MNSDGLVRLKLFLKSNGYKSITLRRQSIGSYHKKDSEWNYSDIPHLNVVHTRVEGYVLSKGREHISSIFLQKIGPISLPARIDIFHEHDYRHIYVMSILSIVVCVETTHEEGADENECITTTNYVFYYKGVPGRVIAILARWATKRNYEILMSEDMPMRRQRGLLRSKGVRFLSDSQKLIGFTDTERLEQCNVDQSSRVSESEGESYIFTLSEIEKGKDWERFFLRIKKSGDQLIIYPTVCEHEGAPLRPQVWSSNENGKSYAVSCPWHGKRVRPLVMCKWEHGRKEAFVYCGLNIQAIISANKIEVTVERSSVRFDEAKKS